MRILINPKMGASFVLAAEVVAEFIQVHPELFEELVDMGIPPEEAVELYGALEWQGKLWVLKDGPAVRTNPWLIAQFDSRGPGICACSGLKTVDVPDDVSWYIYEDDCGAETVHEVHRSWR